MPKNPHADFSPVLDSYSRIGAFRFWCQTALPLTYDDSLSYYELLNKVVNYLNHTIEDLTAVESNTSALAEAYDKLQKYVNDYFDDLDVEAELRNVLDAMAEDGTLDALLDPLVENQLPGVVDEKIDAVVAEQIDGAVAGQIDESVADQLPALVDAGIPGEVSDWLEENVNPVGSAVMVDSSLTISGAAADAKVTGDELSDLKTQLNDIDEDVMSLRFIDGVYINTTTDTYQSASSAKWILYPVSSGDVVYIKAPVGYSVNYTVFDAYIPAVVGETPPYANGYSGGLNTISALQDVTITIPADGKYLVFAPNNSAVSARILTINGVSVDDLYTSENLRERVATIKTSIENELGTYDIYTPAEIIDGVLKSDGTIETFNIPIKKYENLPTGTLYIKGTGTLTPNNSFCYAWRVKNGVMVDYVIAKTNPQIFDYTSIEIDNDTVDGIWLYGRLDLCYKTANDKYARQKINTFENYLCGMQWKGKTWYAYGTSITSVHQNTGKYPTYLAQMSGMMLVEKGIGGGGIGNLGAYSQGQVYNAICNITDGKLNADLISLETGANDVNADVPLGTIYDEGQTTLAGCLNDCLRYLQANTNAQIFVTCSPATTTKPEATNKYYEWAAMIEQICHLNRVHFLNADNNMGWAKLADSTKGQLYVADNIHQTDLGGYIMAENLWYQLRNIPLFYTEIPT